jgi:hypothetical protein
MRSFQHPGKWLRDPIVLFEGTILDGRNRHRACEEGGVPARYETLPSGVDPQRFVFDKNLVRRHLSESQHAYNAAQISSIETWR